MKLSISNIGWVPENDLAVYEYMKNSGFEGLEIAPTRVVSGNPYEDLSRSKSWYEEIRSNYGFDVPSIQSMWFGHNEKILGSNEDREFLLDYTKKAIDFASVVKCPNIVFGCPRHRAIPEGMSVDDAENILIPFFKEISDYAYEKGTIIALEANPPIYNTNVMNTTREAVEMIAKVDSKGCMLNLDVGTMVENGEAAGDLRGFVNLINHVHISEPFLNPIVARDLHKELKAVLEDGGYDRYISIEMGSKNEVSTVYDSIDYVKGIFA